MTSLARLACGPRMDVSNPDVVAFVVVVVVVVVSEGTRGRLVVRTVVRLEGGEEDGCVIDMDGTSGGSNRSGGGGP